MNVVTCTRQFTPSLIIPPHFPYLLLCVHSISVYVYVFSFLGAYSRWTSVPFAVLTEISGLLVACTLEAIVTALFIHCLGVNRF